MSEVPSKIDETILSYFLKNASREAFPANAAPHTLHPFASPSAGDPSSLLKNLVSASSALDRTLQSYTALSASDHKFVSILRQSTTLVNSLHTSKQDARRRVDALKARSHAGTTTVYEEPVPLDSEFIVDWSISRIEDWGRGNGMEIFRDEEDKSGKMTITLGGKVLVIDVDLHIQRSISLQQASHITVSNIKTSHALPSGSSGNALAEKSVSLDAFMLRTWNSYLEEVQKNDVESSMRAAHIGRDIRSHLSYLMKLDALASQEGDQGIRWFNDTGFMSVVAEQIYKTEADCLSIASHSPAVNLDVFLSRAHALAIPYLAFPSMSFLVYLSPIAYYSLLRAKNEAKSVRDAYRPVVMDSLAKLDIPLAIIHKHLTQRELRPPGTTIATLILKSISRLHDTSDRRTERRPLNLGRPHYRLPGASALTALDHILIAPSLVPEQGRDINSADARDVWMLDFTDGGHSAGVVMTHSRMREIQQVVEPASMGDGLGFGMQIPPLPGSWISLLISPGLPPSERYIAIYKSPSNVHPPLRLRLTVPNEAGFILQHVPVTSLKQVYGVLEIVRDQCWINETLKATNWSAEEPMPNAEGDGDEADTICTPEMELDALMKGTYMPSRIPVNVFLPIHSPSFPSGNIDSVIGGMDLDTEHDQSVPGLSSVSMSSGVNTPVPCIAFTFLVHSSQGLEARNEDTKGLRQVAVVLRHDRSRRRGVRIDVNVSTASDLSMLYGESMTERPSKEMIEDLEEKARRGGAFGISGNVWEWLTKNEMK